MRCSGLRRERGMNDLISVIIPVYKVEEYLSRCVDSVLAQTYRNLEIFLVDDGSPDRCGEICDAYAAQDSRIHVIHKQNGGLSDARNAALDVCTGEYISFVDSDDYVSEDFVESLYHALQTHQTKLAICGIMKFDENGSISLDYSPSDTERCVSGAEMVETVWRPSACNKMYHKSLFDRVRYPFGKLYEDLFIYHDILAMVDRASFSGRNSYYYFNRQGSIINKRYDIRNADIIEGLDLRILKLREMGYDDLADRQLPFLFNSTLEALVKLKKPNAAEKERLRDIHVICNRHFSEMMAFQDFSRTQKMKIALFRYLPGLYLSLVVSGI